MRECWWVCTDLKYPGVPKGMCGPLGRENRQKSGHLGSCPVRPAGAKGPGSRKLDVIRGLRPVKEPQTTAGIRNASTVPKELQEGGIQQEPQKTT